MSKVALPRQVSPIMSSSAVAVTSGAWPRVLTNEGKGNRWLAATAAVVQNSKMATRTAFDQRCPIQPGGPQAIAPFARAGHPSTQLMHDRHRAAVTWPTLSTGMAMGHTDAQ